MKKIFIIFFVFLIIPVNVFSLSISGRSAILMDVDSGRILYEKDIDTKRLIASTTKIMTCLIALENGNLDDMVTVGDEVLTMYGTNIYIEVGEKMSLRDLLYGLMLRSGNDASVVIAKHIGGTIENFVNMMNEKAGELGMKNTVYNNPHGLDEETKNYSTAYDLAILSSYASKNKTYLEITSTKKYSTSNETKSYLWYNRNKLISYKKMTSGKTGYTPDAGKTIVSTASNGNLNLTAVSLNDGNIYTTSENLYEYGFSNYKKYLILDKNNFKIDSNFYKNKIYIKNSFSYPLTDVEKENIKVLVKLNKFNNVKDNEPIGTVNVYLDNNEIYSDYVYVSNKKISFIERIKMWFK